MDLVTIIFYIFASLIVISAAVVVFSRNIMYSAFGLLFTFFGVAAIYILLNADFLALTQIMIYIGGILVLIIFGVMLTSRVTGVDIKTGITGKAQVGITAFIIGTLAIALSIMYSKVKWNVRDAQPLNDTITPIGRMLLTDYLLAFEIASIVLLIAIIGAVMIARRKKS